VTSGVLRVALTGGIATGKSYCLARFQELGAPTIDADVLARQSIAPGTDGFDAVMTRFGEAVRTKDGGLDRDALARLVFSDETARHDLERIVHPFVYSAIAKWLEGVTRAGLSKVAIADIPLLFETRRESDFDKVVVAACRPEQQLKRLMERGMAEPDAQARIDAQLAIDRKVERADFVIDTSDTETSTSLQVVQVWEQLTGQRPAPPAKRS
jgi:dephospho-CoA kinase